MSGPKETWGKAHPVSVAPPSTSYNPPKPSPPNFSSSGASFPRASLSYQPSPFSYAPSGPPGPQLLFWSVCLPSFLCLSSSPYLSALMGPFSLDFSRYLWLNSPSYLEQNPSPPRYLETVTSQFRSDVSTQYLHVRSETNYWKF